MRPGRFTRLAATAALLALAGCPSDDGGVLDGAWVYDDYIRNINQRTYHGQFLTGTAQFNADGTFMTTFSTAFPAEEGGGAQLTREGTWSVSGVTLTLADTLSHASYQFEIAFSDGGSKVSLSYGAAPVATIEVLGRP